MVIDIFVTYYVDDEGTKNTKVFSGYTMGQVFKDLQHFIPNPDNIASIVQVASRRQGANPRKPTRPKGDNNGQPFAA